MSWPVAHAAFADPADPVLAELPARWRAWGSTSTGAAGPGADRPGHGEYLLLAYRWLTCSYHLSRGLLGQVEGRTADDAAYWPVQQSAAWRHAVQVVAIDICSIYASAVRRMLPKAMLVVDLFHVVQLAVKMTADVRRRVARAKYWRRGPVSRP